jgi:transposase
MSSLIITHYFPFSRVCILRQRVSCDVQRAYLEAVPDKRFRPLCRICGRQATGIHSQESRWVRDLDFGPARVWIHCHYRKIICPLCQKIPIEEIDLFDS